MQWSMTVDLHCGYCGPQVLTRQKKAQNKKTLWVCYINFDSYFLTCPLQVYQFYRSAMLNEWRTLLTKWSECPL